MRSDASRAVIAADKALVKADVAVVKADETQVRQDEKADGANPGRMSRHMRSLAEAFHDLHIGKRVIEFIIPATANAAVCSKKSSVEIKRVMVLKDRH